MTAMAGGFSSDSVARMSETLVSVASSTGASSRPSRWARSRTWAMASSPEMYTTRSPLRASAASAWSSRVDLPMPGSPPISTPEPGTKPPPATRSSSAIPVTMRGGAGVSPRRPTSRVARPLGRLAPLEPDSGAAACSSTMEFHAPQLSQRPDHLEEAEPQLWQTNWESLAMPLCTGTFTERKGASLVVAVRRRPGGVSVPEGWGTSGTAGKRARTIDSEGWPNCL